MVDYSFTKTKFLLPIEEIEESALKQFKIIDEKPYVIRAAAMPDAHSGKSEMPVGGVALTNGVIAPEWVGVDIGCGVTFYDTKILFDQFIQDLDFFKDDFASGVEKLDHVVRSAVPMGYNIFKDRAIGVHKSALGNSELDQQLNNHILRAKGTLGGGNHFIEFGITQNDTVGIAIHTGSRNLGLQICLAYLKYDTHFDITSDLGKAYFEDMSFATNWAKENRLIILKSILNVLIKICYPDLSYHITNHIDIHHNYAEILEEGILHRKGATAAYENTIGLIPGNMEEGLYIVRGKGNGDCLWTCSHGAGRKMSRSVAHKTLNINKFKADMKNAGVYARICPEILDESKDAYKDFQYVIALQQNIVFDVVDYVKPFCNIKDITPNKKYKK